MSNQELIQLQKLNVKNILYIVYAILDIVSTILDSKILKWIAPGFYKKAQIIDEYIEQLINLLKSYDETLTKEEYALLKTTDLEIDLNYGDNSETVNA